MFSCGPSTFDWQVLTSDFQQPACKRIFCVFGGTISEHWSLFVLTTGGIKTGRGDLGRSQLITGGIMGRHYCITSVVKEASVFRPHTYSPSCIRGYMNVGTYNSVINTPSLNNVRNKNDRSVVRISRAIRCITWGPSSVGWQMSLHVVNAKILRGKNDGVWQPTLE